MAHDRIQGHGYKHICDRCECDAAGAQCVPYLKNYIETTEGYDKFYYTYTPSCTMAHGHLCSYYHNTYIKPRIKKQ